MDDDYENCPLCNKPFSIIELVAHVDRCTGGEQDVVISETTENEDEDFKLAMKLQEEENKRNTSSNSKPKVDDDEQLAKMIAQQEKKNESSAQIKCQLCGKSNDLESIYILDECTHKFCKTCIQDYVANMIQKSVKLECPLKECGKDLSVRDLKDLLPTAPPSHSSGKGSKGKKDPFNPTKGTGQATERIMAELKHIMKSDPEKNGYSVNPIDDNIYKWELKLFNFDKSDPLGQDMSQMKVKNILLHVVFPQNYPFSPPYIRVIKPRFQYRTGHVTIGGSICMEILTNKGWSPVNTLEAIIVSIRAQLIAGGARLDTSNKHEYTEQEAKDAFDRMVRDHGWF